MTTTPNQPTPDRTRSIELLEHLLEASETQTAIISDLANSINNLVATLTAAAQQLSRQPAAAATAQPAISGAAAGNVQDFNATAIIMTYNDKGEPAYKLTGYPFASFGVRAWPEVLPALGINPDQLRPGPNPINLQVRAMMIESTSKPGTLTPKKIIGLAP